MVKRLALLKELLPSMTRAGVLLVRNNPSTRGILEAMGNAALSLNMALQPIEVGELREFGKAFLTWEQLEARGFVMQDHGFLLANAGAIAELAVRHRLLSIGPLELPSSGGLLGYGVRFSDFFGRAAYFVEDSQGLKTRRYSDRASHYIQVNPQSEYCEDARYLYSHFHPAACR
jgi:hypothetical protein